MPASQDDPTVEDLVAELRIVRERGLVRLRHSDTATLSRLAEHTNVVAVAAGGPRAIESIIRAAVENLGGGHLEDAARATFGLDRGSRDRPAQERRRHAAVVYGVSVERFRKYHERIVLEQVAEEILRLGLPLAAAGQPAAHRPDPGGRFTYTGSVGDVSLQVVVRVEPVELLSGVDVVLVPTNTYLELPQTYKSSVSAAVRRSAAIRKPDGQVVSDVVAAELGSWLSTHGRPGLPVAPGTVVATSSGELARRGVRRLDHVAVASPRPYSNDYDVEPAAIAAGVRQAFALARDEQEQFEPPLRSIGLPLLGAGRGGLDPATSLAWLWSAVDQEVREHGPWEIHLITRRQAVADTIVARLAEAGVITLDPTSELA
jgi:O-acetyl-ADP-ribose deacetylase (regulator of RNase III)